MKLYLPFVLSVALLAGVIDSVQAQSGSGTEASRHSDRHHGGRFRGNRDPLRWVERLSRRLDLDETQQQNLANVVEAAKPEFEALRERARDTRSAMRELDIDDPDYAAKLDNLAAAQGQLATDRAVLLGRLRAEVGAQLTPEQRAEMNELMDGFRSRAARRHRDRSGDSEAM